MCPWMPARCKCLAQVREINIFEPMASNIGVVVSTSTWNQLVQQAWRERRKKENHLNVNEREAER